MYRLLVASDKQSVHVKIKGSGPISFLVVEVLVGHNRGFNKLEYRHDSAGLTVGGDQFFEHKQMVIDLSS
jgi:hypothetical protein